MSVNPSQLSTLLAKMIDAHLPVLITGAPGVGKSDIVAQSATVAGAKLLISHPAVSDPTDFKGLPWFEKGDKSAQFKPFGEFDTALQAKDLIVWLFDDLGQASPAVQAACMQLFLARRVNGHVLPDCVTFIAATNRRSDRAGVAGILEPVKSRFAAIVELEADIDSWCNWAYANNIPPVLIAFLRYRTPLLSAFQASADLTNSPVPRTWANLAKLEVLNLPAAIESEAMSGAVGQGAALEYLAFRQMANSLVNLDAILMDPDKAKIPSKPSELYATSIGLAGKANTTNFARIATYAVRMAQDGKGEFAVLLVRDAIRKDEKIQYSDTYVRMMSGPIGALISGRN